MKPPTLTELKTELKKLTDPFWLNLHPRVLELKRQILAENKDKIDTLKKQIAELQGKRKPSKRWPDNVPPQVLKRCYQYWDGTTESNSFRIHLWNDKAVWTSYPAGGYSNNMGWVNTSAAYYLVSMTKSENSLERDRPVSLEDRESVRGNLVTKKYMQAALDALVA